MRDESSTDNRVVVEITRRGKLVVGEPFFTPGVPLVLDRKGLGDAGPGDLALVRTGRGRARLERVIGPARAIESALEGLLVERGARPPAEPYTPPEPTLEGRVDLRDLLAFTIDPETAKDFDDALSVRREPDGFRAWVHIADVSFFVPTGSPLDRGAAERATSVYVPGRVAPMLPHELADDLCSLRPDLDRACVTVEFPPRGEPLFYRSTIRSRHRLSYGQVERILRGHETAKADLDEALRATDELTTDLRRRRFVRGSLRIESPEIAFEFDGRGGVERAWRESEPHAHALVEELMIRANEAVAELLSTRRRETLYRVHECPDPQAIALLLARLADLEVPTPPAPDQDHMTPSQAADLAAAASERVTDYVARAGRGRDAFPPLVLRSLKQARYHPENLGHSGLASRAYCHFTSPIRRYPDLICHRALLRELGAADDPLPADLDALAEHTSLQERAAAEIEYRADELCLAWLLERELFDRGWEEPFEGEIVGVIGSGLFVRFGDVFEGFLPARRLPGDYFELNPVATALVGRRAGARFRLGDRIRVRVEEIRRAEGKVELAYAAGGPSSSRRQPRR
jgi:ribonuclease R